MRILIVGDFNFEIYEKSLSEAFTNLGHEVKDFSISERFQARNNFYSKIQNHIQLGPDINRINNDLLSISKSNFDFIFLHRPRLIKSKTLKKIKHYCKIFIYNNDDPFGTNYRFYFWWRYMSLLKHCDHIFSYRKKNIKDYKLIGYDNTSILMSYFIEKKNFLINKPKINDLIFIGHYENDDRDELLKHLVSQKINLCIFGNYWEKSKHYKFFLKQSLIGPRLDSKDYNEKLNNSKIALVLFSKLNNDGYTRRCFEIPRTKSMMVSEYSDEIIQLYEEDKEIVIFKSKHEAAEKIKHYLNNMDITTKIAENAYAKVNSSGHEILDRAKQIINIYNNLNQHNDSN